MSVQFFDREFTFHNPDGSEVHVRGWGNQFTAVFETLDGYTVVRHPRTRYYHYAGLSDDGTTLVPLGARVGGVDPSTLGIPRHVRVTADAAKHTALTTRAGMPGSPRWAERRAERDARQAAARMRGTVEPDAAITGGVLGLCLLVQFPDVAGTIPQAEVTDFCNQLGYTGYGNNGSVRDYFRDTSGGRLDYRNVVTVYYTTQHRRDYYTDPLISYGTRAQEIIHEALTSLRDSGFDFTGLTADSEGFINALNVFYAGYAVNDWSEGIWPHSWGLAEPFEATPTTRFRDYQISDMGESLSLGTYCHENGHMVCDLPDLYDYGGQSAGVGNYCLMCAGGGTNPVQICGFLKNKAGWADELTELVPGNEYAIDAGRNDFLRYRRNDTEYFILENRVRGGRDANLPDAGLLIWHVDEYGSNDNEQMTPTMHYLCSLEQADGAFHLEHGQNSGDTNDLYGAPTATTFGDYTLPAATWWDGSPSGLRIEAISAPAPRMTFRTGSGRWHAAAVSVVGDRGNNVYAFAVDSDGVTYVSSSLSGSGGAWTPWEAGWHTAPPLRDVAATGDRSNSLYVFGIGPDDTLYATHRDATGAWSPWQAGWNAAPLLRSVVPVCDTAGVLYVFGLGPDGTVHVATRDSGGTWGPWRAGWNKAPKLTTLTTLADLVGRVFVFGVTADETVYLTSRGSDGRWTAWTPDWNRAPKLHSIAAAHDQTSVVHVFGVASDGTAYATTRGTDGAWSSWAPDWNGAPKLHVIAPLGAVDNTVTVFGVTPDDEVCVAVRDANRVWSPWTGNWHSAPGFATVIPLATSDNTVRVIGVSPVGVLYVATRDPHGAWSGWTALN